MATEQMNPADQKLVIPAKEEPSIINGRFFRGAFIGSILGVGLNTLAAASGLVGDIFNPIFTETASSALPTIASISVSFPAMLATTAIGYAAMIGVGLIDGGFGKKQMERESQTGKEVSEPSFWNKGIFRGLFVGGLIGTGAMFASAIPAALGAAPAVAISAVGLGLLTSLVASVWGGIAGGFQGKAKMQEEYNQALALREQSKGVVQAREREAGIIVDQPQQGLVFAPGYKNSVSAEEAHTLNARLRQGDPATAAFAQQLQTERSAPADLSAAKA